jgi:hypothetical protein
MTKYHHNIIHFNYKKHIFHLNNINKIKKKKKLLFPMDVNQILN